MAFVHLHCHTEYSLLDGITRVGDMAQRAYEQGNGAVAITDHGYMYGCMNFYRAAIAIGGKKGKVPGAEAGVKPILGCEVYFTPDRGLSRNKKPELYHMVLLAKNNNGYKNLMNIVSEAAVKGFYYKPRVTIDMLEGRTEGLIGTSACIAGIIPKCIDRGEPDKALEWANTFGSMFGADDFYIELQNHGILTDTGMSQVELNRELVKVAKATGIKPIATNDFHYLTKADAATQDAMLCIGTGSHLSDENRFKFKNDQFYMKTEAEMREAIAEFPEACDNTVEVAEKCNVNIEFGHIVLPKVPLPKGETNESELRKVSIAGLTERYGDLADRPDVMERFEHEYEIICTKGFAAYFLIVQEFTAWAKAQGIGVGPGRGSAAGSIVSYALDITTFDPLANNLLFERFLSPERTEMPDIDMDFDDERRLEVVEHVREVYGRERIAHVITYGSIKAKQAINDAARVMDIPIFEAQKLSKMISSSPGTTLKDTLKKSEKHPEFFNEDFKNEYNKNSTSHDLIDKAMAIEGLTRGEGIHASAVLICRDPVSDYVPIKYDTKGGIEITQYDGATTADLGLLKMDFLGLRTLTVISRALANIKKNTGEVININDVPMDDPEIFSLMSSGRTAGVFQVESGGMTATIKNMKPREYRHVVALIALYRPGPLNAGMVTDYIDRMNGKKQVIYYDDRLKWVLEDTYGTIVYQEQVMQISMEMSGFSAGESDKLRKAVAKKKIALMTEKIQTWADGVDETMEDHWMNGAVRRGYTREIAVRIWEDVKKFAEYAFNKSHSAAYAILVMQTAWLKVHYPHEYDAAVLTSFAGKTEKITHYVSSFKHEGVEILSPDVNESNSDFTAVSVGVRFGMAGVKGVGSGVAEVIMKEREENGAFKNLHDFVDRVDAKAANRRVVEALIRAGAFDFSGYPRKQMMTFVDKENPANILDSAAKRQKDRAAGQVSMFEMFADIEDSGFEDEVPKIDPEIMWDRHTLLAEEKTVLGIYVSDHPLRPYEYALYEARDYSISDIEAENELTHKPVLKEGAKGWWAGMVSAVDKKPTKTGKAMAIVTLEDMEGETTIVVFPKLYDKVARLLEGDVDPETGEHTSDVFVRVKAKLERSDRGVQLIAQEIAPLVFDEKNNRPKIFEVCIMASDLNTIMVNRLKELLAKYKGHDEVELLVEEPDGRMMRAELPLQVNAKDIMLVAEVRDVVGLNGRVSIL